MMYRYLRLSLLLLVFGCDPDTSSSPSPEDVFVKLYGSSDREVAADIISLADGGFAIFGTTTSNLFTETDSTDRDFYLVFVDSLGNYVSQFGYDDASRQMNPD